LLPAQRTDIDATFNPALLREFDNILRSQFQSVNVVPEEIPTTDVDTLPTTGKLQIAWLYDCTLGAIADGGG
jgi:hypothetical protein